MSRESRKAQTEALLARIEEVVSGHDTQRSYEGMSEFSAGPTLTDLWVASTERLLRPLMDEFAAVWESVSRTMGLSGEALIQLVKQIEGFGKVPPVPAKAAHRRKYSR